MVLVTLYISCTHWLLTSHSSHVVAPLPGSSRCGLNTVRRNCDDVQLRVQWCTVCTVGPVREICLYTPAPGPARTTGNTATLTGLCRVAAGYLGNMVWYHIYSVSATRRLLKMKYLHLCRYLLSTVFIWMGLVSSHSPTNLLCVDGRMGWARSGG